MTLNARAVGISIQSTRCFSAWNQLNQKSPYEILGVSPNASQADIKSAFYKQSKRHHPDANSNDPSSTAKFQALVEAYEILGTEASRKRHDKGMPTGKSTTSSPGFKAPPDPQAAFYRSRLINKMNAPTAGRTYDFDAWTRQHYSESMRTHRDLRTAMNALRDKSTGYQSKDPREPHPETKLAVFVCSALAIGYVAVNILGDGDSPRASK